MSLKAFITLAIAALVTFLMIEQYGKIQQVQNLKEDQAVVLNIKYGLLSLDEWKAKSYEAISHRVQNFRITGEDRDAWRPQIQQLLYTLIDQVEETMNRKANESWWQRIIAGFVKAFAVDFNDFRRDVPRYTEQLLSELENGQNQDQIRNLVLTRVWEILDMDAPREDQAVRDHFFPKYNCSSYEECGRVINQQLAPLEASVESRYWLFMACGGFVCFLFLFGWKGNGTRANVIALVVLSSVFLIGGLLYPMLSIDARVTEFNFEILGMQVAFGEQVLFYRSKSILDVTFLLLESSDGLTKFAGIAIMVFSVIFPVIKLLLSLLLPKGASGAMLKLATNFSRLSMVDVFVVAIFLGFLGINGIIDSQIARMESNNPFVDLIATNNTSLETGFALFSMFCAASITLGYVVKSYVATEE